MDYISDDLAIARILKDDEGGAWGAFGRDFFITRELSWILTETRN